MSSTISGYTSTFDYSSLFSSWQSGSSSNSSGSMGLIGLSADYSTISSGSYGKLLSSYYKKMDALEKETEASTETKNRQLVAGNASTLGSAAAELKKMNFAEASEENSLKAVKSFVSAYNSVIDTADDVDSISVLRNTSWMTNMMSERAGLLSDLGISIGTDNKLSVDEAKWKEADATSKASLFSGHNGLAEKLLYKADRISAAASKAVSNTASAYTPTGDYANINRQSLYEALV